MRSTQITAERVHVESGDRRGDVGRDSEEGFGPIKTLLGALEPARADALREELRGFFEGLATADGAAWVRDYLLVLGSRRS